jgi:hypothetical protein
LRDDFYDFVKSVGSFIVWNMTIFKYKREQLNYHRPPLRDLFAGGGFTSSSGGFETALLDDRPPALGGGGVGDFDFALRFFEAAA